MVMSATRPARGIAALLLLAVLLLPIASISRASPGERLQDVPIAVTKISAEDIAKLPAPTDLSQLLMVTPGQQVTLNGQYKSITLRPPPDSTTPNPIDLPLKIGELPDGKFLTEIEIPKTLRAGPVVLDFAPVGGDPFSREGHIYGFLRAWIEQDKLRSFQSAGFGYDIDFGRGPGEITLVVTTVGPIRYAKAGQPQSVSIGPDGRATFSDHISALKGSPVGTPFTILPKFSALKLRK